MELEQMLERVENGAQLPEEPGSRMFVANDGRLRDRTGRRALWPGGKAHIPYKRWAKWGRAHERMMTRWTKALRDGVPVRCKCCGRSFYRRMITQKRCDSCITALREMMGGNHGA